MKKNLLFIIAFAAILIFASSVSQDKKTTSCHVYDLEDVVVTVDTPIVTYTNNRYNNCLFFSLSLSKPAPRKIGVSVEFYDSSWVNVKNETVFISEGKTNTFNARTHIQGAKDGDVFYVRLSSASCK